MRKLFPLLASVVLLCWAAQVRATTLPDACGDDKVKFDASKQKATSLSERLPSGKARIVFVEMSTRSGGIPFFSTTALTTRLGLDGHWAGAVDKKTYVSLVVDAGERHLCASVQGKKEMIGVNSLTAQEGQTYYFQFEIKNTLDGQGFNHYHYGLTQLSEDEGKFRIKAILADAPSR